MHDLSVEDVEACLDEAFSSMPIEEFRTTLTRMFFLADGKPRICGGGH